MSQATLVLLEYAKNQKMKTSTVVWRHWSTKLFSKQKSERNLPQIEFTLTAMGKRMGKACLSPCIE
jgi:hypothetical protein